MTANTFTYQLTNDTLEIIEDYSIFAISVVCVSDTPGTLTGNAKLGTLESAAITANRDIPITISSINAPLRLTITAPAGCTLLILASS